MFDQLKEIKHFKEVKSLKSVKVKAEAYVEPSWASVMELFSENSERLSAIFVRKLYSKCSTGFWIPLLKDWDFQNEANPANIYFFKVKNRNAWKSCEICSKLTIRTPERRQWIKCQSTIFDKEVQSNSTGGVNKVDPLLVILTNDKRE